METDVTQNTLDTPIGVELKLPVTFKMSDDEDAKKAGETKIHTVDFVFDATWTPRQLAERCVNASSARVTFQNSNRGKDTVPREWKVNKAGVKTAASETDEVRIRKLLGDAQVDAILAKGKDIAWIKSKLTIDLEE